MIKTLLFFSVLIFPTVVWSTDLKISNVRSVERGDLSISAPSVIFDISWKNSWNNNKNKDAVWVFLKFNGLWDNHVKINATGNRVLMNRIENASQPTLELSSDRLGFFIHPPESYRGDINVKVQIQLDTAGQVINYRKLKGLSVHGIEMVYIPQGPFTLGSPDKESLSRASLYKSDDKGESDGLIRITSESSIEVGPKNGALYYKSESVLYNGDQKGPIPADFPKGYDPFYIMKYELTQGQYCEFLNTIPEGYTFTRSPIGGKKYYEKRGSIVYEDGKYMTPSPNRPMNFVSFTDGLAFTDWAALRPITELEYTKAARGPSDPIPYEFVWGSDNYDKLERYVTPDSELILANGKDESMLTDQNRATFGASYYWVMDLSGSVWEKVITIGNPIGRSFKGSHGDGTLSFGNATNEDWPTSDNEIGGFGYRGGGFYEIGTYYSDFNPHSPIGYRYYGSWSGGPRSIAYGYRAGRSAQ